MAVLALLSLGTSGKISQWSESARGLYGWSADEAQGRLAAELLGGPDRDRMEVALEEAWRLGSWNGTLWQVGQNGERFTIEGEWSLVGGMDQPEGVLIVHRRFEGAPFEERHQALVDLAGAAGHELKNLFTHLRLYTELLSSRVREEDQRMVSGLDESVRQGIATATDLMLVAGGDDGEVVPVNLKFLLGELQKTGEEGLPEHTEVATQYPQDLAAAMVDIGQIRLALRRLCETASQELPKGGTVLLQAHNMTSGAVGKAGSFVMVTVSAVDASVDSELVGELLERPVDTAGDLVRLDELDELAACAQTAPDTVAQWRMRLPARIKTRRETS